MLHLAGLEREHVAEVEAEYCRHVVVVHAREVVSDPFRSRHMHRVCLCRTVLQVAALERYPRVEVLAHERLNQKFDFYIRNSYPYRHLPKLPDNWMIDRAIGGLVPLVQDGLSFDRALVSLGRCRLDCTYFFCIPAYRGRRTFSCGSLMTVFGHLLPSSLYNGLPPAVGISASHRGR